MMSLTHKGGRKYTRGWTGAKWVKRMTAKKSRRNSRETIRDNEGEDTRAIIHGWVW